MRQILHVDMDAFFASVEILDDPSLAGLPLVVAGTSKSAIVTTASYEAREYGIHSAMPVFTARSLCPDLVLVPVRKERYREVSRAVFALLSDFTKRIEKTSIDEAYLDISHSKSPVALAYQMKQRVREEIGITMSCGLSYNKFLAKMASDMDKPDGFTRIRPEEVRKILDPLPVSKIHGVGRKGEEKLNHIGIYTGRDLYALDAAFLTNLFGKFGPVLYDRIRGIDEREVELESVRKSIGCEETFLPATKDRGELSARLARYAKKLMGEMNEKEIRGYTLTIKTKDDTFSLHTRSKTFEKVLDSEEELYQAGVRILEEMQMERKIRLLGMTVSNLTSRDQEQLYFL